MTPLANEEVKTLTNYCWLGWMSRIHGVACPSRNEPWLLIAAESWECCVVLLVHRAAPPQSLWPRFSANTRSALHSDRQRAYGTRIYAVRWARLPQPACISGRTRTPLEQRVRLMQVWRGTELRRLIGWRLAGIDGGRVKRRKSLLWS